MQHMTAALSGIERLNSECYCVSLDAVTLRDALESELGEPGLANLVSERCPYLFSARPVFISAAHLGRMARIVGAVESVVALPAWRERVVGTAQAIGQRSATTALGVFFGYDFHLNDRELGLIEINTNAGGAMLNAVLARAQMACCPPMQPLVPAAVLTSRLEDTFIAMFRHEWALAGKPGPLRSIAVLDEAPEQQYLYPEFLLFRQLFLRHGIEAVIAAPADCRLHEGALWVGDMQVDLVYNRLTDFLLAEAPNAMLKQAYLDGAVVVTPHPQAWALYADKRNLALLTDAAELAAMQVPAEVQKILLTGIPRTEVVDPAHAERLWATRKHLFFKPTSGYGSRAAYRGDKVTTRVWQEILAGDYVAQALVAPGERVLADGEAPQKLKFDVRNYVYNGNVQWVAARLYQGQTTNFRTPGGGFAPVYSLPADA